MQLTSESVVKLATALAAANLPNPTKSKTATVVHKDQKGRHSYNYATLSETIDVCRGPLSKEGLSVIQLLTQTEDGKNLVVTRLMHSSGEWAQSTYPIPSNLTAQDMGSAIAYARKYSYWAIVGIAAEDDDDDGAKATEAEQAASEAEESQKKAEARARIDELKAKGQIKSAYTGKELKPGEEAKPEPTDDLAPVAGTDALAGIAPALADLMRKDCITPEALKSYSVKRGHIPAPGMEPANYPGDYIKKICQPNNWASVVKHIKGETK